MDEFDKAMLFILRTLSWATLSAVAFMGLGMFYILLASTGH